MSVSRSLVIDWWFMVLIRKISFAYLFHEPLLSPAIHVHVSQHLRKKKTEPTYLMTDFEENLTRQFPLVHFQSVMLGNVGDNYLLGARLRLPRFILTI